MKTLILLSLLILSISGYGQTQHFKNTISFGGGRESYNGDLGNSWFNPKEEFYGFFYANYSRYLNKSFNAGISISYGDYGHCRDEEDEPYRADGSRVLNMYSRLTSVNLLLRYKLSNGYILKETSKFSPSVFLGTSINNLTDIWTHDRVNSGNYTAITGGIGVCYNVNEKFNINYNWGLGYFTTDNIDYRAVGKNDMYMQHTISFGYNF